VAETLRLMGVRQEMTSKTVNLQPPALKDDKADARDDMGRSTTHRGKGEVRLGREVQARIGQQLRAMYDDVVSEGVPQQIADLVNRLSDQDDGVA
jgi:hypothetical protein